MISNVIWFFELDWDCFKKVVFKIWDGKILIFVLIYDDFGMVILEIEIVIEIGDNFMCEMILSGVIFIVKGKCYYF